MIDNNALLDVTQYYRLELQFGCLNSDFGSENERLILNRKVKCAFCTLGAKLVKILTSS